MRFTRTTLRFLTACPALFVGKGFVFFVSSKVLYPGKSKTFIAFETLNHLPLPDIRDRLLGNEGKCAWTFIQAPIIL